MKKRLLFILACLPNLIYAQSDFESQFSNFNLALLKDIKEARVILNSLEQQRNYENDTFKMVFYLKKASYFKSLHKLDSAKFFIEKSLKLASEKKADFSIAAANHDLAEILSLENKNELALQYDSTALHYAQKINNKKLENIISVSIARKLRYTGDFEQSNKILFKSLPNIPSTEPETYGVALATVAMNYDDLALYELTEKYYLKANEYLKLSGNKRLVSNNVANLANLYINIEAYDKALIYADSILFFSISTNSKIFYHLRKAEAYKGLKKWAEALKHIDKVLVLDKEIEDEYSYTLDLIMKGQIYKNKGDFKKAFSIFKDSKELFKKNEVEDMVMEEQLSRDYIYCYLKLNNPPLSSEFENYISIVDKLGSQSKSKNLIELEAKYNSQQKETKIATQKLEMEKQKNIRNLSLGGGVFLLFFAGGGFFWYRNQQKRKTLIAQNSLLSLEQSLIAVELSQINQQLNPHEFKNLIASISPQIQEKAPEAYRKMLHLLNVIKPTLYNSGFTETIEQQVKQVNSYLLIMQNNLSETLEFQIENGLAKSIEFPRLILKNIVENAVKHGIKGKAEGGTIQIKFYSSSEFNILEVEDNGKGRDGLKGDEEGFGLSSYRKLFRILNRKNNQNASLEVIDKPQGVKVIVKIPPHYQYR